MSNKYILVLTHDIDELSLKEQPFNLQTLFYPFTTGIFRNAYRLFHQQISLSDYRESLKFALFERFFSKYTNTIDSVERSLDIICEIEDKYGIRSTHYFIPFKNYPGHTEDGNTAPSSRACSYDITRYSSLLCTLENEGWEVGIHGLDAYLNIKSAKRELDIFKQILPQKTKFGIRMHWLYHKYEESWKILDKAGYFYDATFGWNDKIGFRDLHYRPFKPDVCENLYVLPLNIQENVLLRPDRLNLNKKDAWIEVEKILKIAKDNSAIITILWHNASFVAPRHWTWLYEKIIQKALDDNASIIPASKAIELVKH